jgi:hypothetical protein
MFCLESSSGTAIQSPFGVRFLRQESIGASDRKDIAIVILPEKIDKKGYSGGLFAWLV